MDTTRFDSLTRRLAIGTNRRHLVQGLAALGLGGSLVHSAASRVASLPRWWGGKRECGPVSCPPGYTMVCQYRDGHCIGCRCCDPSGSGIGGGGLVRTESGEEADLLLFATQTPDPNNPETFKVEGQVRWNDPNWTGVGLRMESSQLTAYEWTEDVEDGRDIVGWMNVSALESAVPFLLQAVDAGGTGSGQDTVRLLAGDQVPAVLGAEDPPPPSGFSYEAEGTLERGDLALLNVGAGGEHVPATPAP